MYMTFLYILLVLYCGIFFNSNDAFQSISRIKSSTISRKMFSGIVEEMGIVEQYISKDLILWDGTTAAGVELTVACDTSLIDSYIGCSIAVNGVCLTATMIQNKEITFGLAPETLRRTNLGLLSTGNQVNLERALSTTSRNSGHFVQVSLVKTNNWTNCLFNHFRGISIVRVKLSKSGMKEILYGLKYILLMNILSILFQKGLLLLMELH